MEHDAAGYMQENEDGDQSNHVVSPVIVFECA
jgi:hypothetical protein